MPAQPPLLFRVVARFLAAQAKEAKVVAPNSTKAKPFKDRAELPGKGRFTVEPLDSEDTFPPVIESFEVIDGWVFYHGTNGSEGVVAGPQRKLDQWAKDIVRFRDMRQDYGHKRAEPWTEEHGGAANVKAAIEAAEKMLRLGGVRAEIRVWVESGRRMSGDATGNVLNLANVHEGGTGSDYIGGIALPLPAQVGAHEAAHVVYSHGPGRAKAVLDTLKQRQEEGKDYLSAYHALAGHFEGVMEAAALYVLTPARLQHAAPEVFEAVKSWLG